MRKHALLTLLLAFFLLPNSELFAQWEPTGFTESTWVLCKTSNGNLLASNDVYPDMGGIFLSEDQGDTWVQTSAEPFSYTSHLVDGENIYMGGVEGNIAISSDNGHNWTQVSIANLFPGISEYDPIYALEAHNDRIYAAVLAFGIAYSEDGGATWNLTDLDSLLDPNEPDNGGQWCYHLRSFNGKLYNLGAFGIFEYNEEDDFWVNVDANWYAGYSLIVDDKLYVIYNAPGISEGIRYTSDFQNWDVMPIGDLSTSIRFVEYSNGAFFMGNVRDAIFYTVDNGQNWIEYREDFPKFSPAPGIDFYETPMNMVFLDDDIYVGVFSPDPELGGVYKAPMPEGLLNISSYEVAKTIVYPNPAKDNITFKFPEGVKTEGNISIMDVTGKIVYRKQLNVTENNSLTIPVNSWAKGIYFYTINGEKLKSSGKFIVR